MVRRGVGCRRLRAAPAGRQPGSELADGARFRHRNAIRAGAADRAFRSRGEADDAAPGNRCAAGRRCDRDAGPVLSRPVHDAGDSRLLSHAS